MEVLHRRTYCLLTSRGSNDLTSTRAHCACLLALPGSSALFPRLGCLDADTSDPFVKGTIGSVQFSTKHINKTLNPKWFDAFKLPIVQWRPDSTSLTIEVFDKNAVAANVSIGRCILDLNRFRDGMRHDLWLRLENAKCGKIHVAITDLDDTLEIKSDIVEVIPGVLIESWRVQSELLKGRAISA